MSIVNKLTNWASLAGVVGALGGGFYAWGEFNTRLSAIENQEFVINETVDLTDIEKKLTELETTIIGLDNDVLDNLRNDIAGNSNDIKAMTSDIIKDIKVIQSALAETASNDDLDKLDKKLRTPIKELEEYAWELEEDIEENSKGIAIIKKENELQDVLIEEIKESASNPLNG